MLKPLKYYVGKDRSNNLLLHCEDCKHLPTSDFRTFIGSFYTPNQAFSLAARKFSSLEHCTFCQDESKHYINDETRFPYVYFDSTISLNKGKKTLKPVHHPPPTKKPKF